MLQSKITIPLIFCVLTAAAASSSPELWERTVENRECTGANDVSGVCISTSVCSDAGGTYTPGTCSATEADIQCCKLPTELKREESAESKAKNLGEKILAKAKTAKGTPYVYGGGSCNGPTKGGFDCSGLLSWAICQVTGRNLFSEGLRKTSVMYCTPESKLKYKKIPFSERRPGDAVFFGPYCDCERKDIHHVGIMVNKGTKMWNALKTGTKVREDDFAGWSGENTHCPKVIRFT